MSRTSYCSSECSRSSCSSLCSNRASSSVSRTPLGVALTQDSGAIQGPLQSSGTSATTSLLVEETSLLSSVWNLFRDAKDLAVREIDKLMEHLPSRGHSRVISTRTEVQEPYHESEHGKAFLCALQPIFTLLYRYLGSKTGHHEVRSFYAVCQPPLHSASEITTGPWTVD